MNEIEKPVYIQVIENLKEEIMHKCPNEPIMSERELALHFNISRMTARKAVDALVNDGYLYRIKNKGTFVADKTLYKSNTLYEEHEDTVYKNLYFNVIPADKEIAEKLNVKVEELILKIVRTAHYKGQPQTLDEIYFVKKYLSSDDIANISKVVNIKKCINESVVEQRFYPMIVPFKYAVLLEIAQGTPIINVQSIMRNHLGVPTLFFSSYLNPHQVTIQIKN